MVDAPQAMTKLPLDRFEGALIGLCLGDALGLAVLGQPPHECARYADKIVRPGRLPKESEGEHPFGQYSADSQMARELLQSFVAQGRFVPEDYAARIAALFAEDRAVMRGRATSQAAEKLQAGFPWHQAATPAPAAGNGSAVRAMPLGLMFSNGGEQRLSIAATQSRITHDDSRCAAGAAVVADAIALAGRGPISDRGQFLGSLTECAQRLDPQMAAALRRLHKLLDVAPVEAAEAIARLGLPPGVDSQWRGGISGFVVASVAWGLYAFLHEPKDWSAAVAVAIAAGGDTRTTGALTGALAGAHLGQGAIPAAQASCLTDRGHWGRADLLALAGQAYDLSA